MATVGAWRDPWAPYGPWGVAGPWVPVWPP